MDLKTPPLRQERDDAPTPAERPRLKLPPPPRGSRTSQSKPLRPPILGSARRSTQMVDTNELDNLLERDRRAVGVLGHQWFRQEPSEAAVEAYDDRRRTAILSGAATVAAGLITMTVLFLLLTWS